MKYDQSMLDECLQEIPSLGTSSLVERARQLVASLAEDSRTYREVFHQDYNIICI